MKLIKIRNVDTKRVIHQFIVPDSVLALAEKLGIDKDQYIIEQAKVELEERKVNEHTND